MDTKVISLVSILLVLTLVQGASVPDSSPVTRSTKLPIPSTGAAPEIDTFGYNVIRNSSFPCETKQQLSKPQKYRFHPLDDDDKIAILEAKGGKYIKEYMAKDKQSAHDHFPSLLDVDFKFKLKHWKKPKWTRNKAAINHWMKMEAAEEEQSSAQEHDAIQPTQHRNATLYKKDKVDKVFVKPSDIGIPDRVLDEETGELTEFESCLARGTRTEDNAHLYMCTTCTKTTTLGDGHWPPIINEAGCIGADPGCFIVEELAQGMCKHKVIAMQILKKNEGSCELGLKNGETVIVDDWGIWDQAVHVGCECVIHIRSEYAKYVGRFIYNKGP